MLGHNIVGNDIAAQETMKPHSGCPVAGLGLSWRMAQYEAETGEMARPEWFDGPDGDWDVGHEANYEE